MQLGKRGSIPYPEGTLFLPCSSPSSKAQDRESGWLDQVMVCFELGCGRVHVEVSESKGKGPSYASGWKQGVTRTEQRCT